MLAVRASVILLHVVFRRSQGVAPPALLDSVVVGAALRPRRRRDRPPLVRSRADAVPRHLGGGRARSWASRCRTRLGNLFSGIALHTEAPFRVGDWVRLGDRDGRVEQVSWRATRLRTWYGDTLTIPNNEVARHPILNYSLPAGGAFATGADRCQLPDASQQGDLGPRRSCWTRWRGCRRDPRPVIRIIGYQDFSILYEIRYFFDDYEDYRRIEGEIHRLIWYHFRRHGIEIPFPMRNVFVHQVEAPAEPAETRDAAWSARCGGSTCSARSPTRSCAPRPQRFRLRALRGRREGHRGGEPRGQLLRHRPRRGGGLEELRGRRRAPWRGSWRGSSSARWRC